MNNEKATRLAAKLYECRDAARTLLGDKYHDRMAEYERVIRGVAAERCIGLVEAGTEIATKSGGVFMAVLVLAATVEAIEPSNEALGVCIRSERKDR